MGELKAVQQNSTNLDDVVAQAVAAPEARVPSAATAQRTRAAGVAVRVALVATSAAMAVPGS